MGNAKWNCYPGPHFGEEVTGDGVWKFRLHHGNLQVDTSSPDITHGDYKDISAATGTQTAFDDACADVGGLFASWYGALAGAAKALVRESVIRMHETS